MGGDEYGRAWLRRLACIVQGSAGHGAQGLFFVATGECAPQRTKRSTQVADATLCVCVSVCLCACVCVSVCLSLSKFVCLSVRPLFISLSLSLPLSLPLLHQRHLSVEVDQGRVGQPQVLDCLEHRVPVPLLHIAHENVQLLHDIDLDASLLRGEAREGKVKHHWEGVRGEVRYKGTDVAREAREGLLGCACVRVCVRVCVCVCVCVYGRCVCAQSVFRVSA